MARGFFSGVIAGTLVSGLGLGVASVLGAPPQGARPAPAQIDLPEASGFNQARDDTVAALPSTGASPEAGSPSGVSVPEPDDIAALDASGTQPAAAPETGGANEPLDAPAAGDGAVGVSVDSDSPVLPSPQSEPPEPPASEADLPISTDPAQPALPAVEEEAAAFPDPSDTAPAEDASDAADAAPAEDAAAPSDAATAPDAADEPGSSEASDLEKSAEPASPDVAEGETEAEPETEPESEAETAETAEPATAPAPTPEMDVAQTDEAGAEPSDPADAADPSGTIGDLAVNVETNRLPSVGDPAEEQGAGGQAEPEADTEAAPAEAPRPLERFAAQFDDPGDKPLMAIILIDDGSSPVGLEALQSFPYPLSFAVDASAPDATEKMKAYRAAGFEVLALADLPEGAGAQDAEVAMQATLSALPEAVGVMEGPGAGLQSSREAVEQLAPILLESGHGLVLFPKGLNTAQKLLAREGVPAAAVFRDFDAKGQNATVIRRFLDQAAFKAGQENAGVVMVGRLRPDTVSALLLWGLQDRADRVALAPISALLRGE